MSDYKFTPDYASTMDQQDPLASFRDRFLFPQHQGKDVLYFCGNSLGLQPKNARTAVEQELDDWAKWGVEGHFEAKLPWFHYHKFLNQQAAQVVGAQEDEVVIMNNLTTNLHLMMVSFYRPTPQRYKIIMEAGAFPSDQYAMESQVKFHGYDPATAIVEVTPRVGEHTLRTEDILHAIEQHGSETALVIFGGVNYYTGQFYNLEAITEAAHQAGAVAGFDLAHAAGNIPLRLHDWDVDFAVWCSYKYLNSGPGGTSGAFVHEKHGQNPDLPRFAGWWGHDEGVRFLMKKGFHPMKGAAGWQLSNAQIFPMAIHKASLSIFEEAGMSELRKKSLLLTGYMEYVLQEVNQSLSQPYFEVITPKDPESRGCQLSILAAKDGKKLFEYLTSKGVVADWREPNVIRVAPVPLYNSFTDVYEFGVLLKQYFA